MKRFAGVVILFAGCASDAGGGGGEGQGTSSASGSMDGSAGTDSSVSTSAGADGSDGDGSGDDESGNEEETSSSGAADTSGAGETTTGDVVEPALFVHGTNGVNSNPGTEDAPLRTIQVALERAVAEGVPNIHVAAGEYTASIPDEQAIEIPGGVSLHGGFAADDWSVCDPVAHPTRITGQGGFVVRIVGGEREDTAVDGFVLEGTGAGPVVLVEGSPTIRRNVITQLQSITNGVGIEVESGSPRISRNRILVLDGNDITFIGATGIRLLGDGALVDANMIYAQGEGLFADTHGTAVYVGSDAPVQIHANSLRGAGTPGRAVSGVLANAELVGNNFIVPASELFTGCIDAGSSAPAVLTHNNFDCAAFYTVPGSNPLQSLAALHAAVPGASDNVAVTLQYVDPLEADLHIVGADRLLCEIAVGGTDLGALVDRDYDDVPRTVPWTIGAEEHDSPCV